MDQLTELRFLNEKLTKTETILHMFFDFCPDFLAILDISGKFVKISQSSKQILGFEPYEMENQSWEKFCHPDDLPGGEKLYNESIDAANTGGKFVFKHINRYKHKNGNYIELEWHTWGFDQDGLAYGIARPIKEPIDAEE